MIGDLLAGVPSRTALFAGISGDKALAALRRRLSLLGFADAAAYRLHDFRRGHAQDLAQRGRSLAAI